MLRPTVTAIIKAIVLAPAKIVAEEPSVIWILGSDYRIVKAYDIPEH